VSYKWIGAILIIAGCGAIGFSLAASHRREERTLRQFLSLLDYMECELQYHLTPLPELCRQASEQNQGIAGKWMLTLSQELAAQISPDVKSCVIASLIAHPEMPKHTRDAMLLFGSTLGRFGISGQVQELEAVRDFCRRELDMLGENRDLRLRGYQTLGLCAGAALAILFV
jgi:stage III sporulation protein AB